MHPKHRIPDQTGCGIGQRRYTDGMTECQICGKPVNTKRAHWMVELLTDNLGWFPVGPECRKTAANSTHNGLQYGRVERWEAQ